jgi:hypothetical protein
MAAFDVDIDNRSEGRTRGRKLAELAERQHGVVARTQLRALGFENGWIDRQVGSYRLHGVYRGVYAVGHARLTRKGRWMGAVLAAGREALLSHRSAAALWGLTSLPSHKPEVLTLRRLRPTASRSRAWPAPFSILPQ